MDKWNYLRNKNTIDTINSFSDDQKRHVRNILKERARHIKEYKTFKSNNVKSYVSGIIIGFELSLYAMGIDIKRYGG